LPVAARGRVNVHTLQGGPQQLRGLPQPIYTAIAHAVANSIHTVFLAAMPVSALSFCLLIWLKGLPLRESAHVGVAAVEAGEAAAAALEPASAGPDSKP